MHGGSPVTRTRALGLVTLLVLTPLMVWTAVFMPSAKRSMELPKALAVHAQPRAAIAADPTNHLADSANAAVLGERLFFDAGFSATGRVSCSSCHDPTLAFTDRRPVAVGELLGKRNSPTVLGAARRRWFTWDGRADTMWSQAAEPIEQPAEHGFDRTRVATRLRDTPALRALYESACGAMPAAIDAIDPTLAARPPLPGESSELPMAIAWAALPEAQRAAVNAVFANTVKSLGAYQRTLDMPLSRFDAWAAAVADGRVELDDPSAGGLITEPERRGWELFSGKAACINCHGGREFSDGEFHNLGLPGPDGRIGGDPGRRTAIARLKSDAFSSAGEFSDDPDGPEAQLVRSLKEDPETWGQFRTPSLRGVSLTAPYMHDGRFATLEDVVAFYDTLESALALDHHRESVLQPLGLTPHERADLVAFLRCLDPATQ